MGKFFLNSWNLVQGSIAQVAYHILDELGEPFDTSGATAAYLEVKNADGTTLQVQTTQGMTMGLHPPLTIWTFNLSSEQVMALPLGRNDAFIRIAYSDSEKMFAYPGSITIAKKPIANA